MQQKIKDDPKIYNITRLEGNIRINLKPDELAVIVRKLINASFVAVQSNSIDDSEEDMPFLVGRQIKMFFENDTDGNVVSTVCICVCPVLSFICYEEKILRCGIRVHATTIQQNKKIQNLIKRAPSSLQQWINVHNF